MSTISLIGRENADGTVTAIYCHWDGHPEHNGRILVNHYQDEEKISALLALGSLSILGPEIGEQTDCDKFDAKASTQCLAYGRDRGHPGHAACTYLGMTTLAHVDGGQRYVYVWSAGAWWAHRVGCYLDDGFTPRWEQLTAENVALMG